MHSKIISYDFLRTGRCTCFSLAPRLAMALLLSAALSGAGASLVPQDLTLRWKKGLLEKETPVVEFYKHKTGEYRCFSNFFQHADFVFEVPEAFCAKPLQEAKRRVPCAFSEKAIMLCKAAAMGDLAAFDAIAESTTPGDAKRIGRSVQPFDYDLWNRLVLSVAYEVALQKFTQLHDLQQVLLSTGDRVIAEMTNEDSIWGTGAEMGSAEAADASKWPGTNILGWALAEARATLRATRASEKSKTTSTAL